VVEVSVPGLPHFAVPLRLAGTGAFASLEQDSPDEVAQCVAVCLLTAEGSRAEVPAYGAPRGEFVGADPGATADAVQEWEPRADLDVEAISLLGEYGEVSKLTVRVRPHI
jgi:phage baseplate assembly protein W